MPDIKKLLNQSEGKKRFQRSSYRPWNFMDAIESENINNISELNDTTPSVTDTQNKNSLDLNPELELKAKEHTDNITSEKKDTNESIDKNSRYNIPIIKSDITKAEDKLNRIPFSSYRDTPIDKLERLAGHQKKLFEFIYECCLAKGTLITGPINMNVFVDLLQTTPEMVRTTIKRLCKTNVVSRAKGKRGRGGFHGFYFDDNTWNAAVDYKKLLKRERGKSIVQANNDLGIIETNFNGLTSQLPREWEEINFSTLQKAFGIAKTAKPQFFGKAQLKSVFHKVGNKLSPNDVQTAINNFAFGLQFFHQEEPYKRMINPAAVLLDNLKNGDIWQEPRYLTENDIVFYKIYVNYDRKLEEENIFYFNKWVNINKEEKYQKYKKAMRSNEYYDEKIFFEKAKNDYLNKVWPEEKKQLIMQLINIREELFNKFINLKIAGFLIS